jgi:hypothetical protein
MSSKLIKQFIKHSNDLDELVNDKANKDAKGRKKSSSNNKGVHNKVQDIAPKSALESQIESILFFDRAFSNRTYSCKQSLETKLDSIKAEKKNRKKDLEYRHEVGNTRSSSSKIARKAHLPTFDKKKYEADKKVKSLKELAKLLKKDSKKKR